MTKRYFYTDPLEAAYMAKHHRIAFKSTRGQDMYFDGGSDFRIIKDGGCYAGEYYYVHPNSEHFLEPQEGDKDEDGFIFSEKLQAWERRYTDSDGEQTIDAMLPHQSVTAKRNGKAFFTPEREEV